MRCWAVNGACSRLGQVWFITTNGFKNHSTSESLLLFDLVLFLGLFHVVGTTAVRMLVSGKVKGAAAHVHVFAGLGFYWLKRQMGSRKITANHGRLTTSPVKNALFINSIGLKKSPV